MSTHMSMHMSMDTSVHVSKLMSIHTPTRMIIMLMPVHMSLRIKVTIVGVYICTYVCTTVCTQSPVPARFACRYSRPQLRSTARCQQKRVIDAQHQHTCLCIRLYTCLSTCPDVCLDACQYTCPYTCRKHIAARVSLHMSVHTSRQILAQIQGGFYATSRFPASPAIFGLRGTRHLLEQMASPRNSCGSETWPTPPDCLRPQHFLPTIANSGFGQK